MNNLPWKLLERRGEGQRAAGKGVVGVILPYAEVKTALRCVPWQRGWKMFDQQPELLSWYSAWGVVGEMGSNSFSLNEIAKTT
jgi:hypothetical protein